jgi:F0F1-type ATP synthase membrane subunit b/b'
MKSATAWWWTYAAAQIVIFLALWSCGNRPPVPVIEGRTVPADQRIEELLKQEGQHRLAMAQAQADAKNATQAALRATTAEERAKANADRIKAEAILTSETLMGREVTRMREEQEAAAKRQRQELDDHRTQVEAATLAREIASQAASDRRTALITAAIALGIATAAGFVMVRLGIPMALAALAPGAVAITAGVGLGVLAAGPWLSWVLQALVGLALVGLTWKAAHALGIMAWFGHHAAAADPADTDRLANLRTQAQAMTEKAGCRWLVRPAVRTTRPTPA